MDHSASNRLDDEQRTRGLNYARNLNFTDQQYEEALKRIDRPDNLNQLLVALIDVSTSQQKSNGVESESATNLPPAAQNNQDLSLDQGSMSIEASTTKLAEFYAAESFSCSSSGASSLLSISSKAIGYQTGSSSSIPRNSLECLSQQQNLIAFDSSSELQLDESPRTGSTSSSRTSITAARANSSSSLAGELRPVYVDGSNVARTHGREAAFSWAGIEKCVNWFRSRRHIVRVLVPEDKVARARERRELAIVNLDDVLDRTPAGCNDDLMIIKAAMESGGVIVSNDLFRDERRWLSDEQNQYVSMNRLPYAFIHDRFIPAEDPLGRSGPNLDQFLRTQPQSNPEAGTHQRLSRTRSHQPNVQRNHPSKNNHIYRQGQQQDYRSYRQVRSWQGSERPTSVLAQNSMNDAHPHYNSRPSFVNSLCSRPEQQHALTSSKRDPNELERAFNSMRGNFNSFWKNQRNP